MWGEAQDTRKQAAACGSAKKATRSLILKSEPKASGQGWCCKVRVQLAAIRRYGEKPKRIPCSPIIQVWYSRRMGTTQMLSAGANSSCRTAFPFRDQYFRFFNPDCALVTALNKKVFGL